MTITEQTELAQLEAVDLAELTLGLSFLFWSLLVFMLALTETLASPELRAFPVIFLGAGGLGTTGGAYRLCRITALGAVWRQRTRELAVATVAVAYLSLFYLLWRQVSTEWYLLVHALGFFGMVIVMLGLLCPPVRHLARAAGRRNLGRQCAVVGVVGVGLLAPAGAGIARTLMTAARHGRDPLLVLQLGLERTSLGAALLVLLPVALLLSLVWTGKELALTALRAKRRPAG